MIQTDEFISLWLSQLEEAFHKISLTIADDHIWAECADRLAATTAITVWCDNFPEGCNLTLSVKTGDDPWWNVKPDHVRERGRKSLRRTIAKTLRPAHQDSLDRVTVKLQDNTIVISFQPDDEPNFLALSHARWDLVDALRSLGLPEKIEMRYLDRQIIFTGQEVDRMNRLRRRELQQKIDQVFTLKTLLQSALLPAHRDLLESSTVTLIDGTLAILAPDRDTLQLIYMGRWDLIEAIRAAGIPAKGFQIQHPDSFRAVQHETLEQDFVIKMRLEELRQNIDQVFER